MQIRKKVAVLTLSMLISGCAPEATGHEEGASSGAASNDVVALPAPVSASDRSGEVQAKTAAPITIVAETSELEFRYVIPREATAISPLRALLTAEAEQAKMSAKNEYRRYARDDLPAGVNPNRFSTEVTWRPVGTTEQLLVLVSKGYAYTGGAHGSDLSEALLWDKAGERRVPLSALFTDQAAALATIRPSFCSALADARAKRLGRETGTGAYDCPRFDQVTLAPTRTVGGKFGRIGAWVAADTQAEGGYTLELFIPAAMIPFVAPEWRVSFPG